MTTSNPNPDPIQFHDYLIYSDSRVWSTKGKGTWMKPSVKNNGYVMIRLRINNETQRLHLHRLVLSTFAPIEGWESLQVNHKNGKKTDCRLENLEWVTRKENMQHALHVLKSLPTGEKHYKSKLKNEDIAEIKKLYAKGNTSFAKIAKIYGCSRQNIGHIIKGLKWNHI